MDFFGIKTAEAVKTASTTESTCQGSPPPTQPEEGQTGGKKMKTNSDKFDLLRGVTEDHLIWI